MKPTRVICPFCGQPTRFIAAFPGLELPPGPLVMLALLWRFQGQLVPYESLRDKQAVSMVFAYNIRQELQALDLPWKLENEPNVGYRLVHLAAEAA